MVLPAVGRGTTSTDHLRGSDGGPACQPGTLASDGFKRKLCAQVGQTKAPTETSGVVSMGCVQLGQLKRTVAGSLLIFMV